MTDSLDKEGLPICDVCNDGTFAAVRAFVDGGCIVCKKESQNLCEQHWVSCTPLGKMGAMVVWEYDNKSMPYKTLLEKSLEKEVRTLRGETSALISELIAAIIWCAGSKDFNEGGIAEEGWKKGCVPLIKKASDFMKKLQTIGESGV